MYAEERQHAIVLLAQERGRVGVADLARRFKVTPETVRRDLETLASAGSIDRVHGGAVPAGRIRLTEAGVALRETSRMSEKARIARAALSFLPTRDDTTVLLDGGTTTARLAELLVPGQVGTIVTNSVLIAGSLAARGVEGVHMLGGRVRGVTHTTVGSATVDAIRRLRVDVSFVGANGFSLRQGLSTPDPSEAEVKSAIVRAGGTVVALADASKYNSDHLVGFADLAEVDVIVTDKSLPTADHSALVDQGIEVVLA